MNVALQYQLQNLGWALATVVFIIIGSLGVAWLAQTIARWRGATQAVQRRAFWGFLFASPWIIGFVIFVLGPSLASLYYSFTNYKLGTDPQWTGLDNYRQFIMGEGAYGRRFKQAMFNSFYYAIVGVPLQLTAALGMAILLNQKIHGIRIFRMIFYTPVILAGGPAILLAWRYMLSANGGFVNVTLQNLAKSFFLFDWLYRGFIFSMETFNGLYAGLSRGDPIGPFKYAVVALIAVLSLAMIAGSDWTPGKRERALRVAEIIAVVVLLILFANGIVAEQVDPLWIIAGGLLVGGLALSNLTRGHTAQARTISGIGLALAALVLVGVLVEPSSAEAPFDTTPYLLAVAAAAAPLALSLFAPLPLRRVVLTAGIVLAGAVLLVALVPQQFGETGWQLPLRYLTLGSALTQPDSTEYLNNVYPSQTPSVFWFYGALVAVLVAACWLGSRHERPRRLLVTGALVVFGLFLVGSTLDGLRYFNAYEQISSTTGTPNYHFTLFRSAIGTIPDNTRVPLWLSSELWTKPALVLITMWSSGAAMLIFLAALKGVPGSLYEAAEVDGANRLQKFFKITLPMISPALFYNMVIGLIAALQTFETVYILQTPNTVDSVRSAAFFLYERTFREQAIGQGASLSWILAVIIVALTVMQFRYSRWVHYEV